ncbi:MAG: ATP-binding protein [Clostridia bacterium]|nr:ATP-binding protein [Clostridia bacterium]
MELWLKERIVENMESAYTLANKELEDVRRKNRDEQSVRQNEVLLKIPEIADIEANLMKQGARLLSCVLNRCEDFEDIKATIQQLQKEKAELLKKNGFSEEYLNDIYSCNKCRDTGFVEGRRCECLKSLIVKNIGENSNLTEHMREQKFENFDISLFANQDGNSAKTLKVMQTVCDKAMDFSETFDKTKGNFLIMGNAGTGKTFITSCIGNRALERGKTVYYQTAFRLFEIFENAKFGKGDDDAAEIVKYVYDVDLLIIDDLGTEFTTQFTTAALFDIINSRIIAGKSTVISSNLGFEELSNLYSQRITSRFIGDYQLVQTMGKDLRDILKKRNKNAQ